MKIICTDAPCRLTLRLIVRDRHHHQVNVGTKAVTLIAGETRIVRITLNSVGQHLLGAGHVLNATLVVTEGAITVSTQTMTFRTHAHLRH